MIIGIGTDIVQIPRIERVFAKYGRKFVEKNFHSMEIKKFNILKVAWQISFLSKRFAAKEAVAKALGTGITKGLRFKEIAIINDEQGAPKVIIDSKNFCQYTNYKINISMSDDYPIALAFAVISLI